METIEKEGLVPLEPWTARERKREPWIKAGVNYAEHIVPQNEQKSNLHLTDAEVLQPRVQPVEMASAAAPISTGENRSLDESGNL